MIFGGKIMSLELNLAPGFCGNVSWFLGQVPALKRGLVLIGALRGHTKRFSDHSGTIYLLFPFAKNEYHVQ